MKVGDTSSFVEAQKPKTTRNTLELYVVTITCCRKRKQGVGVCVFVSWINWIEIILVIIIWDQKYLGLYRQIHRDRE